MLLCQAILRNESGINHFTYRSLPRTCNLSIARMVKDGGLIFYGASAIDLYRHAAQPAAQLQNGIPPTLFARTDEVIE